MRLAAVTLLGLCYPDGAGSQSSSEVALADIDGSGDVGVNDLLLLLSAFGREGDVNACDVEGDIDGDCGVHAAPPARPPLPSTAPRADRRAAAVRAVVGVNDLLLLLSAYGSTTAAADSGCAITAAHRSILSSVESLFPCEDCITACFDQGGVGAEGPAWDEPTATCEFMDAIYTTETHHDCLNSCSHETLVQGFELFLACHGGVAVVGDSFDTPTTLALRATLLNTVDGNCWGQTWSVSAPLFLCGKG